METFNPAYLELLKGGVLEQRVAQAHQHLAKCDVCAWNCKADRLGEKLGVCRTGSQACVSSYGPHMGEENPLRGRRGSGTIFFARCNLHCQYCQNYDISQSDAGEEVDPQGLAAIMLELQAYGCHNINFVSPSHVIPQILAGVWVAAQAGLRLPLVFNTGGYDSLAMLALLEGVIDIYMPDMKYASSQIARHYSKIPHYSEVNQASVKEMHRQVGDLQIDLQGLARRGLLVRHLVLPNHLAGTSQVVSFLANEISKDTYLNLMDQYRPAYRAKEYPKLKRGITPQEFEEAKQMAYAAGLHRLDRG
jgi:putative pyruvate formate lyase activating enzyme